MDDLSGLDWSSSNNSAGTNKSATKPTNSSQPPFAASGFASYPSLRPTPSPFASGRSTPVSAQGSGTSAGINSGARPSQAAAAKPAQDSFSGLFQGGASKNPANLSLRERQELLEAEKRKKAEEVRKQQQANYGDGQFFDVLGRGSAGASRTGSPAIALPPAAGNGNSYNNNDDDLFAAFNADTKVDNASHFPPPASNGSGKSTPANAPPPGLDLSNPSAWGRPSTTSPSGLGRNGAANEDDDNDPFGLNRLQARTGPAAPPAVVEDRGGDDDEAEDDLLGDLGRPVDEVRRKTEAQRRQTAQSTRRPQPEAGKPIEDSDSDSTTSSVANDNGVAKTGNEPFDRAVAQLVDYGFSPENARRGLTESGAGLNVQAAVNWLLDDAHRQAKEKALGKAGGGRSSSGKGAGQLRPPNEGRTTSRSRNTGDGGPAWMREAEGGHAPSRGDGRSSSAALAEGDFAKTAAAMGSNFLKTANSLWKTGQKQLQKAVQDFQQDADPNQPKWMRSAGQEHRDAPAAPDGGAAARRRDAAASAAAAVAATEEAMMLESRPERRSAGASEPRSRPDEPPLRSSRNADAGMASRAGSVPRWQQQSSADPRARLTKQALEAETAQAYVSPSRRRKAPAAAPAASETPPSRLPAAAPAPQPEGDLLSNSTALPQRPAPSRGGSNDSSTRFSPRVTPSPRSLAAQQQPPLKAARQVPPVPPYVLQTSAKHRADGAAHVKRGDYAAAHAAYSSALSAGIPDSHPLLAVLFCNRALTALKTGEPRQAVADADAALAVIGPGRGEGESVALEDGTGAARGMKELYGKALMRKAEALEQMERWAEAGPVWQQCVESGVGGATAVAGRQRCQTALAPKTTKPSTPKPATPKPPTPRPSAPRPSNGLSSAFASSTASAAVPTSSTGRDFAAVERLRAANEAAAQEDAAKLALLDKVDARVATWRDGKKDNLRALLGSMELVLWEGSGWKKVGLHELVMPNKVKVVYMKAIGKTHPDKLPQDASTEIRMIAGMVFSTLNESWDKFKADNKM